ncbi:MAG: metal-dependent transcriptional regulator [Actinobacteria bacterium]|nr:metal-dependent transcriptional regulator [Actinomycetota bacterium]
MDSPAIEEYLEAIYKLQQAEKPVKQSQIANVLNLHPTTVGEMSRRLTEKGLIRRRTGGVELTKKGERAAVELIRRHRLSERFLVDVLGLPWERAHSEACKLEHALSDDVTDSLEKFLDSPSSCPHGHPIPDHDGRFAAESACSLSSLGSGDRGVIVSVDEANAEMLSYLASLGLLPEVEVVVEEVAPFGGPLLVKIGSAKYALGREVAAKIRVGRA